MIDAGITVNDAVSTDTMIDYISLRLSVNSADIVISITIHR
jgi:hypothetical protein